MDKESEFKGYRARALENKILKIKNRIEIKLIGI